MDFNSIARQQHAEAGRKVDYVRAGSKDEATVRDLLAAAGCPAQGGEDLYAAVSRFQKAKNLKDTSGKAGPETLGALRQAALDRQPKDKTWAAKVGPAADHFIEKGADPIPLDRPKARPQAGVQHPAGQVAKVVAGDPKATAAAVAAALPPKEAPNPNPVDMFGAMP